MREYWIIDPERKKAEFFLRGRDGKYAAAPVGTDGIYRCTIIKPLWVRVDWFWQVPLPREFAVYREWGII